ncbi:acyltransferase ChoActase/COT/CPT [Cylindrobasidium torrendii FP15055 ss-10]|uniref:Acyltransferase ChoActase/COT/CPT n=1 Tax=Cylindrobasidium torrendii FP15055 ss-10 TaxID=1314674 RepID=A0A0D7BSR0_9AGAR|nr:acyltransferase ChoActase/COT/CPT [Cylindrobasidium torrendii FP15055 ss-10]
MFTSRNGKLKRTWTKRMSTSVKLPRLPIPELRTTLDRYLKSLEPLLLEEADSATAYESAYTLRAKWADEFNTGLGRTCQERLKALDRASPHNWLDDNFWMKKAYMEWRSPLPVNSNWWLAFQDDTQLPISESERVKDSPRYTHWQIQRAAWILHRILEFRSKIESQEIHPDTTRTGIWLRESTFKMFNVSRVPQVGCDILSLPDSSHPAASSVVVTANGWFYGLPVISRSPAAIAADMTAIVHDVEQRISSGEKLVPVGILSSSNRDTWAANLAHLLALSPSNEETHEYISQSLLVVSLDHTLAPLTIDGHLQSIRSTTANASNRWFDKAFSLIVDPAARAGAMGEHSPCDALVPSIVAEYGIVEGLDAAQFGNTQSSKEWRRLDWVTDDYISNQCTQAQEDAEVLMENSDDRVLWFSEYGADWIKGVAKQGADAYIQMALQLAWYRTRGVFTATYETALTRMFNKGRTETIRTLTRDSRAFVLAMVDSKETDEQRLTTLRRAIQTHTSLTREAATGRGIDRHLMGLRLMLKPGETSLLLEDPLFARSAEWKLSTSGLSAGHLFRGTGFGAGFEDGYGINYLAGPDGIKFGIESKFSSPHTSTEGFQNAVVGALRDMQRICLSGHAMVGEVSSHL